MFHALIGSYTHGLGHTRGGGAGVQRVTLDRDGRIAPVGGPLAIRNASFMCVNAAGDRAYVTSEVDDHRDPGNDTGAPDGCVTTVALDQDLAPALAPAAARDHVLAVRSTAGPGPAHCGLDPSGTRLAVASYAGGYAIVFTLDGRGCPGPVAATLPHTGGGPHATRQTTPHPHQAVTSPDGRWLYVVDLGTDQIVGYRLGDAGITRDLDAGAALPPGSGPRHLAFAPGAPTAWVGLELSSEVTALGYDPATGALTPRQTRSSLAEGPAPAETNFPSEIAVSPDGRFVVVANRGRDCLTSFACNPDDGRLTPVHDAPVGKTPRHFAFTPDGLAIVLAEQDGHRVTSHRFDPATGRITATGHGWDTPSPCAVCFLPG